MNRPQFSFIITAGVIVLIIGALFFLKKTDYSYLSSDCDNAINNILKEKGIDRSSVSEQVREPVSGFRKKRLCLQKNVTLRSNASFNDLKSVLLNTDFSPLKIGKIQQKQTKEKKTAILDFYFDKLKIYRLILNKERIKANIALVLDDWGYNEKILESALELKIPVTYAILPKLPYSSKIASRLNEKGKEFILHLPLEPYNAEAQPLEKNTIFTSMQEDQIKQILDDDFSSLPNLKGVNNHMGSKATEDEHLMGIVFDEIKKNNLYFLDSYTSKNSVAAKIAAEKNVPFLSRDIFIDNKSDKEYIQEHLKQAKELALEKGAAVVIGHAKGLTIEAIKEIIPEFEKEGINFVYLSQILKADTKPAVSSKEPDNTL